MNTTNELIDDLLNDFYKLKLVVCDNKYHPEKNVYNHSIQVFELAYNYSNDYHLIFASLFHDIGKSISVHNHAFISAELLKKYPFVTEKILWLVRNHLRVSYLLSGEMKRKSKIDYLTSHQYYQQLLELRKFDILGRRDNYKINISQVELKEKLIKIINNLHTTGAT